MRLGDKDQEGRDPHQERDSHNILSNPKNIYASIAAM